MDNEILIKITMLHRAIIELETIGCTELPQAMRKILLELKKDLC